MSKYNLTDLYEGMSDKEYSDAQEKERLEAHPEKDKIKAVQAMMAKEKAAKNEGEEVTEITGETLNRIDGLISRPLLNDFLNKFSEIYEDMVESGDIFDVSDVVEYLATAMDDHATDTSMYGLDEENTVEESKPKPGYNADGTPKSDAEMDDDEREEFYNDLDSVDENKALKEHFGRFLKDYQ